MPIQTKCEVPPPPETELKDLNEKGLNCPRMVAAIYNNVPAI